MTLFASTFFVIALFIAMTIIATREKNSVEKDEKNSDKSLYK
jgi:hypothetical protein